MELRVSRSALAALAAHAAAAAPDECCGLLLGPADRVTIAQSTANVAPGPRRQFEIDPQALVEAHRAARAGGPQVLGYYHSHPGGAATPSATDQALASGDGRVWAIVGADGVEFWLDGAQGFTPLSYAAVDG